MKTTTAKKAVKKTPAVKSVKAKKAPSITKKKNTKKISTPEFVVPASIKKTISNEVEKVLTPVKPPLNLPVYSDESGDTCSCCGHGGKCGFTKAIVGLLLIIIGLLYLGKNLGILPFSIDINVFNFWPLIIVVVGFFLVNKKAKLSILTGVIGAASFALIIYFVMLYADSTYKSDVEAITPAAIVPHIEKNIEPAVTSEKNDSIKIKNIVANQVVSTPLHIEGEARGSWFFEASFPIKVVDENLNEIGSGQAKADGEWMTSDFVKFNADINYKKSSSSKAVIIFERDNPSGLESNYEKFIIPVDLQ